MGNHGNSLTVSSCFVIAVLCCGACPAGETVFAVDFEGPAGLDDWTLRSGTAKLGKGCKSRRSLHIQCDDARRGAYIDTSLPVDRLRGCKLILSGMVKGEDVSRKPQSWNGVKFMTPIDTPSGKRWPQGDIPVGTFDWRRVAWKAFVPRDATSMTLRLGLERVTGSAWFDDIRVVVRRPPIVRKPVSGDKPVYTGHDLPRLRGAMVGTDASPEDLRVLGTEWNANLIRWQLCGFKPRVDTSDMAAYDAFLEKHIRKLEAALPACKKNGLMVVVDLHTGPGHWGEVGHSLFTNQAYQDRFVEIWRDIARRLKDADAVWAYDLLNEPLEEGAALDVDDWQGLAERTARAIREIDPERTLIVEPAPWGSPAGMEQLQLLDVSNVVYSTHMYIPHAFTHQGVQGNKNTSLRYPGVINGKKWDKAALEVALKPVIDFQKTYRTHIFIGEFSAIRWAHDASALRYLRDCIDIFEKHDWDWSYHAFREWHGWSVEHNTIRKDVDRAGQTDRKKLLLKWFAKNKRPR